jgi:hypothetical protein
MLALNESSLTFEVHADALSPRGERINGGQDGVGGTASADRRTYFESAIRANATSVENTRFIPSKRHRSLRPSKVRHCIGARIDVVAALIALARRDPARP